ncbi:MAG: ribosome maturation factor RimP [Nocardioides sp.]
MGRDSNAIAAALTTALTEPLAALGLDVEAVEVSQAGKRRVVRIAVDTDGGVTLDDVAEATRAISDLLDNDDDLDDELLGESPYTLEVTSRGVDRPLTMPRHWRRNADRLVKVTVTTGGAFIGRIIDSTADEVTLDVDGTRTVVPYDDILKALIQIEFNRKAPSAGQDEE